MRYDGSVTLCLYIWAQSWKQSMSVDGIFHNTVVSMVVMALLAGVHPCVGMTAPPHLTSYPEAATDGAEFTLSCTPAQGRTLIVVAWYRNNVQIFDTSSDADVSAVILNPLTTLPEYQSVSGRISVSSSPQQFNVTLRTNSTLDQGSVWRCQTGQQFSNNITIELKASIRGPSLLALSQTSGGQTVTLTCAGEPGGHGYISVTWYRNGVEIFKTSSDDPTVIHSLVNTSSEYQSVSGRINVSSSLQQHNVTLRTNSPLDQGSVWTCQAGQQFSNILAIEVKEFIQGASSPGPESNRDSTTLATEGQHTGPSSTEDKDMMTTAPVDPADATKCGNILLIIAVAGSIIVVIVIIVAIATSVLLVRKYKQDIAESNSQMYSTMSRDPNTDNNYTELDHGHTGDKFPTSLSVNTEESPAYYNTAPADSQYEYPSASTE